MRTHHRLAGLLTLILLAACGKSGLPTETGADADGATAPTAATLEANRESVEGLLLADPQDFEDAERGLIARDPDLRITGPEGETIWDMPAYGFVNGAAAGVIVEDKMSPALAPGAAPDSVNPSLWRQARLNNLHGLYQVTAGIYQIRGYDLSNMTLIEGKSGWIVVDPLTAKETASRAMEFVRKHLGDKPVRAVIFSHSHVDHFGGVLGVISAEEAARNRVPVVAPEGFMHEATGENSLAGPAQGRRAIYQFGRDLPRSPRGQVDAGIGKNTPYGLIGMLRPTDTVNRTGQELTLDGVRFVFQNVPESEAPAELNLYLPEKKAFLGAEIMTHTLHNLYTLRGAKVRDALKWSGYIDEALRLYGDAEIFLGSHGWPMWDRTRIQAFLESQRDTYRYIHDQTVRLALAGKTPREIAEELRLPASLQNLFSSRGYYGTVSHNAKAVYQFYFGWYDGNPANLNPLPPEDAGTKYVEFMGGAAAVLEKAQASFVQGEYRWTVEVLNHLVFAEPDNAAAKALLARCYDQLGYQAESAIWRNAYLTGAWELRHGPPAKGVNITYGLELVRHTPMPMLLDVMAAALNGPDAEGQDLTVNLVLTDIGESYILNIRNSVLHHSPGNDPAANATLQITHELYLKIVLGIAGLKETLTSDQLKVSGSRLDLVRFFSLFDRPLGTFNIVTP